MYDEFWVCPVCSEDVPPVRIYGRDVENLEENVMAHEWISHGLYSPEGDEAARRFGFQLHTLEELHEMLGRSKTANARRTIVA